MKATAKAPANIAFIKYWGKKNKNLRIPMNNSISMNLSRAFTVTTVEFNRDFKDDQVKIDDKPVENKEKERITKHLDRIRKLAKIDLRAKVDSQNSFAKGTGIASSASGFAALTLATTKAAGLILSEKKLSILARLGSGSACRSIPDGFVEWKSGTNQSSFAHSLHPPSFWGIRDIIAVIDTASKKVSSSEGHTKAKSSPFFKARIAKMNQKVREIKKAMTLKDFSRFGQIIEEEAINMHTVMMTSRPALYYWLPKTLEIILLIQEWRKAGLEAYFTLDAGSTVHVICQKNDVNRIKKKLFRLSGTKGIIVNEPSLGARLI